MRATKGSWRGSDVTVAEVVTRLTAMQLAAARADLADDESVHPRNSVLDLIVVASRSGDAERAAKIVRDLAMHHPCRAVVVLDQPGGAKSRIDASLTSLEHPLMESSVCQYEEVFLRVQGPVAEHIPSLVEALLIPDVVTYIWWTGPAPLGERRFESALQAADVMLVDSARFARPREAFEALAELAATVRTTVFGDLQWARLQRWREALAQFFNPGERRAYLRGIHTVEMDHVAAEGANRSGAALLTGWLAAALGWKLDRVATDAGGNLVAHFTSGPARRIELTMHPVALSGTVAGEVTSIRVDSSLTGGRTCEISAARDRRQRDNVVVDGNLRGSKVPSLVISCPAEPEGQLLSRLLVSARSDAAYPAALKLGAEILGSSAR